MSWGSDDLTDLFLPSKPERSGLMFGQGVVKSWDPVTAANTVEYRGATLTDLPLLNSTEAVLLQKGSVVGILSTGAQVFIIGRITIPGSADAATALNAIRIYSDTVNVLDSTTSGTIGDLPNSTGPTCADVVVGKSRRAVAFMSAFAGIGGTGVFSNGGGIDIAVSDATTIAADGSYPAWQLQLQSNNAAQENISANSRWTALKFFDGNLNPGLNTFQMKYMRLGNTGTTSFYTRNLTVIPF